MDSITLRLDPRAQAPLYEQLYQHIKAEITSGRYPHNTKLPSKRRLSAYLQCSQNTVQSAYGQLMSEGYIVSKPKSGYYVCGLEGILDIKNEAVRFQQNAPPSPVYRYAFSHHGVDPDSFPFSTWRRITKEVINEYDSDLLKVGEPQGDRTLRSSIAAYLRYSRGVKCAPEQIVVSSGTEFIFQLLIQLFDRDCSFAIENPGYEKLNMIFKSNRTAYKAVPLDDSGMLPDELLKSRADVACVTPSHQFPTGNIMSINRRIQLLNWANGGPDRYIVEDDYDSEFKYAGKPIPSLQGLDTAGKVIYIGVFSKSLTPAIRISYMVLPERLLKSYREKLSFYICPVPTVEQKALHRFIDEGHFERHLNRMRNIYREKRESLVSAIRQALPAAEISGANAGLHILLRVDNGMSEAALIRAAEEKGVKVTGISQYYFDAAADGAQPALLLGFAPMKKKEIPEAVALLAKAWSQREQTSVPTEIADS